VSYDDALTRGTFLKKAGIGGALLAMLERYEPDVRVLAAAGEIEIGSSAAVQIRRG
jgi:hypothetical protein